MMRIAMGSDHAGFELKEHLKGYLQDKGHDVIDVGTHSTESVDYPVYGAGAARKVAAGEADRAIVVCGTGLGIGMAAGKVPGIRCAIVSEVYSAQMSRLHNDANALALGARVIGTGVAEEIVDVWTTTDFLGGRHGRRVDMIEDPPALDA
ncbi:ribose 5-phosphate isomerase B [Propionibacterium freudenreichii]|nr:ribose 5-phosphate isomerase B [Propionibacterium freudenreichii]MDK9294601.1 ribose 5-phosphate isomerase B [Propionibacterium freudenreichii]MDK9301796.1 ribose 5-phosphate isomerase B [Propionibacterium freudenreichii]MDK9322155.1 ribose 5-phosphate isomerase B [Propionibacterium freudenreichii]MDK9323915.1 ribose 5-phosphate isomerase B [Propionibacterium freudenreichii]MDK9339160.1 ribose 5-phosphate isomerase B [Propionibacterium freudenreichii]